MESSNESISDESSFQCLDEIDEIYSQVFWMPSIIVQNSNQDYLIKQCRAIFNKITTVDENFPKLLEEFDELLNGESDERMREVVAMYFEKAADEPLLLNAYIEFTVNLSKRRPLFKKAFISECQKQFEGNVLNFDRNPQLQLLLQEINEAESSTERDKHQIIYDKEKRELALKSTKIICFIGQLFNYEILTSTIMINCIRLLLDRNSELHLEFVCNLLTTIGARLEQVSRQQSAYGHRRDINNCYKKMLEIAQNKNQNVNICSRLRCLILNIIDLRKKNWIRQRESRETVNRSRSNVNQSKRAGRSTSNRNGNIGSETSGRIKSAVVSIKDQKSNCSVNIGSETSGRIKSAVVSVKDQKSNGSVSTELTSKRIEDLLKNELDVATIQKFISTNLAVVDAENVRATLRSAVECLMEEETLKLRGNKEAASILRTFFELLEK